MSRLRLAGLGLSLAAAGLTGWALALLSLGYDGAGLVWIGLGALGLLWAERIVAGGQR